MLKVSEGTLKGRLWRGRRALRKEHTVRHAAARRLGVACPGCGRSDGGA